MSSLAPRCVTLSLLVLAFFFSAVGCSGSSGTQFDRPGAQDDAGGAATDGASPEGAAGSADAGNTGNAGDAGAGDAGAGDAGAGDGGELTGIASFDFVLDGRIIPPSDCPRLRGRYSSDFNDGDAGANRALLRNTGPYPIAFIARSWWAFGAKYVPGVANDGQKNELYGVIPPGGTGDISTSFIGGLFAIVGSVRPFAEDEASAPMADEGTIPWPSGELGGIPASQLYVRQLVLRKPGDAELCTVIATFF